MAEADRRDAVGAAAGSWVLRLEPPGGERRTPASFPASVAAAVDVIGTGPVAWAVHTTYVQAVRSVAALPALGASESAVNLVRLAVEPGLIRTLVGIHAGRLEAVEMPAEVRLQLRDYVRRNIALERVLEAIRLGHEQWTYDLMAACRALVRPEDYAEQLESMSHIVFGYINPLTAQVVEAYAEERRLWDQTSGKDRVDLVRTLLSGQPTDLTGVSTTLGYALEHRYHTGVVLWRDDIDGAAPADLRQRAELLLTSLGATSRLLLAVGEFELWAWGGSVTAPARPSPLQRVELGADLSGVRVAVGRPAAGPAGFRTTHTQAQRAARTTPLLSGEAAALIWFEDVALLSLLTADPEQAADFVRSELGRLAGPGPDLQDLRQTLLVYLECRRSPQTAAAQLFVARNTVTYRVKRAETLIGHSIDERETEVRTALVLAGRWRRPTS